ncbi:hypothetical protein [Moorena sp. SIO3I8]|nr:hypothetical protein [Moorena sp. SIO3I8]NEO04940.1 hypothetical protein [Moorena sp. SIO3I8]
MSLPTLSITEINLTTLRLAEAVACTFPSLIDQITALLNDRLTAGDFVT